MRRRSSRRACRRRLRLRARLASSASGSSSWSGPIERRACSSMRPAQRSRIRRTASQVIVVLGRHGVEVGADRGGAVRVGAAQREIHAALDVRGRPVGRRDRPARRAARRCQVPSGFGLRGQMWPLSRWVCMSTKHGQHHAAVEVDRPACRPRARRRDAGDHAVGDDDVDAQQARRDRRVAHSDGRHRGVGQHDSGRRPGSVSPCSVLPLHGALVPAVQQQPGDERGQRRRSRRR